MPDQPQQSNEEQPVYPLKALSLRLMRQIDGLLATLQENQGYADLRIEVAKGKPKKLHISQSFLLTE